MLNTADKSLKEIIIELLAEEPRLTAERIGIQIAKRARKYSRRAIFKELRTLEHLGVLFKAKGHYQLHLIWIINMSALFRSAYTTHLASSPHIQAGILSAKTRMTLGNLCSLDSVWMQIMFALQQHYPHEHFRIWKPEQWFHLIHSHITEDFFVALNRIGAKHAHIIGHDCYTNRVGAEMIPRDRTLVRFSDDPFDLGIATYITTIGEHLITIRLKQSAAERMRRIFAGIRNQRDMLAPEVLEFMRGKIQSVLVVEHNRRKVIEINNRFDARFGKVAP
jgi:hypothetical protein